MRFLVFVEGKTEDKALKAFLKKWLDQRLSSPTRVETIKFNGYGDYLSNLTSPTHKWCGVLGSASSFAPALSQE